MIPVQTVVTWKWKGPREYHTEFTAEHVNILCDMVARNYSSPHQFVCVTDQPQGLDSKIKVVPLGDEFSDLKNPSIQNGPSCYRRLRMFRSDAAKWFGERFVSLDLDTVITGDLAPLWNRDEDFVAWGDTSRRNKYNGSMILLKAGSRPKVWDEFDPIASPAATRHKGLLGSDQAWLHYCLGPGEPIWTKDDGVYSFRNHLENRTKELPANAKIIFFHGNVNPWYKEIQVEYPWVEKFYRRSS
jgi:hypothetical protein